MTTEHDELYYCLPDLAEYLGLTTIPDNSWYYILEGNELVFAPDQRGMKYDNLTIPLKYPILQVEGVPYVTSDVLSFLGWQVELDFSRQQVVIQRNWGWWL